MNTLQKLEHWLNLASKLGYTVRYENLAGAESGACQIGKQKLLFLDLNHGSEDHLETVQSILESDPTFKAMAQQSTGRPVERKKAA